MNELFLHDEVSCRMHRVWAMPSPETFTIRPIAELLARWINGRHPVVDPFARNSLLAEYSNDIDPDTKAKWHMDAVEFCEMLIRDGVRAQAVLFDPPYSPRQIAECYRRVGRETSMEDTQNSRLYAAVREKLAAILCPGGIAVSCGWNSAGFGKRLGFVPQEILLVCHGGAHNDTIVVVEKKM